MTASASSLLPQAFFLATPRGALYALFHPANSDSVGTPLLYLHPFAEELNTTRRVVAQQARALAAAGHPVLQIDLLGCGDSTGHFEDAIWSDWVADARAGLDWLKNHTGRQPGLWAVRTGALFVSELAKTCEPLPLVLLWQAVVTGRKALQQFLRLEQASAWLHGGSTGPSAAQRLAQGHAVEIAGYVLTPQLATALSEARLEAPKPAAGGRMIWLDLSSHPDAPPSPAATLECNAWTHAGWLVTQRMMQGPLFWQTVGLDDAPLLTQATLEALAFTQSVERAP